MNLLKDIPSARNRASSQVENDLAFALRLQRLLADISSRFVTRTEVPVDATIEETQQLICETLDLDRSTLWQTADGSMHLELTHFWQRTGCSPLSRKFGTGGNLPWAERQIIRGEPYHFSSLLDLPPEAAGDLETLRFHGTRSLATFPLFADGKVFGALAFASIEEEHQWTEDEISGLKLIGQIFGHVINWRRSHERAEQLREEIQRSSRASVLGELAAALAHEINQPLTTILYNAQAARRFIEQGNSSPDEIRTILDDIIRDNKRAGAVVSNLREMLAGNPVRKESSCLNGIVEEVAGFLRADLETEGVDLRLHLSSRAPRLMLARIEIQQILVNLIGNAIHAMSGIPSKQRRIDIHTRKAGSTLTMQIRDRGRGIPQEHLDRIFEPFHTTRSDGLGMGLAICRRIVEAHGGNIRAANHKSGGAEFSFSLPFRA